MARRESRKSNRLRSSSIASKDNNVKRKGGDDLANEDFRYDAERQNICREKKK